MIIAGARNKITRSNPKYLCAELARAKRLPSGFHVRAPCSVHAYDKYLLHRIVRNYTPEIQYTAGCFTKTRRL